MFELFFNLVIRFCKVKQSAIYRSHHVVVVAGRTIGCNLGFPRTFELLTPDYSPQFGHLPGVVLITFSLLKLSLM